MPEKGEVASVRRAAWLLAAAFLAPSLAWSQPRNMTGYWMEGGGCFPLKDLNRGEASFGAYMKISKAEPPSQDDFAVVVQVERARGYGCSFQGTGYWTGNRLLMRG